MDKRQIGGAVLGLASAGLFFVLNRFLPPTMISAVAIPLTMLCVLGVLGGLALIVFSGGKQEKPNLAGDQFNNFGNNFGHMGPLHVHGKTQFAMSESQMDSIASQLGTIKELKLAAVSSELSVEAVQRLIAFMQARGVAATFESRIGMLAPPLASPLEWRGDVLHVNADI